MDEFPHCEGSGICQDDYHRNAANAIGVNFILGSDCSSGCDRSSLGADDCPHTAMGLGMNKTKS